MPIVRVSTKGQIVIPVQLRKKLGINPGTYIRVEESGSDLRLTALGDDIVKALYGMLRKYGSEPLTEELLRERAADREREEAKITRILGEPAARTPKRK